MRQTDPGKNLCHVRMSDFTDTLTIAFVIILLFGSIVIYLYTCIQQNSQKVSLLESILLDLKLSTEIQSYTELPATNPEREEPITYTPLDEPAIEIDEQVAEEPSLNDYSAIIDSAINDTEVLDIAEAIPDSIADAIADVPVIQSLESIEVIPRNEMYDSMTLKELHALGKSRGISGASTMKKAAIIEALKATSEARDAMHDISTGQNSFLETSSPFSNDA